MTAVKHPARYSDQILETIGVAVSEYAARYPKRRPVRVLDPFAGTGRIHDLDVPGVLVDTTGVEIEPEWAGMHRRTRVGNALALPSAWSGRFDVVATSPCYGNRFADKHEARDACSECEGRGSVRVTGGRSYVGCSKCGGSGLSPRRSYRHDLGRPLSDGSAAGLQWGDAYKAFHVEAWREARRVLRPGGLFVLNVKDHVRAGKRQRVAGWHRRACVALGFEWVETWTVNERGLRHGANRDARVHFENVYVFERGSGR